MGIKYWLSCYGGSNPECDYYRSSPGAYETFTIASLGNDTISIRSYNGYYFGIDGTTTSTLLASATSVTTKETWYLEDRSPDTLSDSFNFTVVLKIGCSSTVYDSTSSATKVVYNFLGKTKVIT